MKGKMVRIAYQGIIVAKYSYNELRQAAISGRRIGGWQGIDVYACSKYDYNAASPHFWVLYDDGNKLVKKGYVYGSINDRGSITEVNNRYWYNVETRSNERVTKVVPASSGYSDQVVSDEFFSRVDREINELLAGINEVDLLAGLPEIK